MQEDTTFFQIIKQEDYFFFKREKGELALRINNIECVMAANSLRTCFMDEFLLYHTRKENYNEMVFFSLFQLQKKAFHTPYENQAFCVFGERKNFLVMLSKVSELTIYKLKRIKNGEDVIMELRVDLKGKKFLQEKY